MEDKNKFLDSIAKEISALMILGKTEVLEYIVNLGKKFDNSLEDIYHNPEYKVYGCVSDVYVKVFKKEDKILTKAYAESEIVKAYLYIITTSTNGFSINEMKENKQIELFAKKINLGDIVSSNRLNGFFNIYKNIKNQIQKF